MLAGLVRFLIVGGVIDASVHLLQPHPCFLDCRRVIFFTVLLSRMTYYLLLFSLKGRQNVVELLFHRVKVATWLVQMLVITDLDRVLLLLVLLRPFFFLSVIVGVLPVGNCLVLPQVSQMHVQHVLEVTFWTLMDLLVVLKFLLVFWVELWDTLHFKI